VLATAVAAVVPLVPVGLGALAAWSSTNFGSLALVEPVVPVVPVEPAGARWMHPVTVMVLAGIEPPLCGVVCAAIPTVRIMANAADVPDRTIVFILPPRFQKRGYWCNLEAKRVQCMHEVTTSSRVANE
jgi:hypothetical protein